MEKDAESRYVKGTGVSAGTLTQREINKKFKRHLAILHRYIHECIVSNTVCCSHFFSMDDTETIITEAFHWSRFITTSTIYSFTNTFRLTSRSNVYVTLSAVNGFKVHAAKHLKYWNEKFKMQEIN